jgi:rod shape-determining protein MreD
VLYLKLIFVVVAAVVLEGLITKVWGPLHYVDLFLLITVYFGLMRDPWQGLWVGFFSGIAGDLAPGAGPIVGVGGFSKTLIGFVVATIGVRVSLEGPLIRVVIVGLSSLVNSLLYFGLHNLMGQSLNDNLAPETLAMRIGFETTANLFGGVFIFWLFDKIFAEQASGGKMQVRKRYYE